MKLLHHLKINLSNSTRRAANAAAVSLLHAQQRLNQYTDQCSHLYRMIAKKTKCDVPDQVLGVLSVEELFEAGQYFLPHYSKVLTDLNIARFKLSCCEADVDCMAAYRKKLDLLHDEASALQQALLNEIMIRLRYLSHKMDFRVLESKVSSEWFTAFHRWIHEYGDEQKKQQLLNTAWFFLEHPPTVRFFSRGFYLMIPQRLHSLTPLFSRWPHPFFVGHRLRYEWFFSRQPLLARLKLALGKQMAIDFSQIDAMPDWCALMSLCSDIKTERVQADERLKKITWFQQKTRKFLTVWKEELNTYQQQLEIEALRYLEAFVHAFSSHYPELSQAQKKHLHDAITQRLSLFDRMSAAASCSEEKTQLMLKKNYLLSKLDRLQQSEHLVVKLATRVPVQPFTFEDLCTQRLHQLQQLGRGELIGNGTDENDRMPSTYDQRALWCTQLILFVKSIMDTQKHDTLVCIEKEMQAIQKDYQSFWSQEHKGKPETSDQQEKLLLIWYEKTENAAALDTLHQCRKLRLAGNFSELRTLCLAAIHQETKPLAPSSPIASWESAQNSADDVDMAMIRAMADEVLANHHTEPSIWEKSEPAEEQWHALRVASLKRGDAEIDSNHEKRKTAWLNCSSRFYAQAQMPSPVFHTTDYSDSRCPAKLYGMGAPTSI